MGIIAQVTSEQCVAAKAMELLAEVKVKIANDPGATDWQRHHPHRTAWCLALEIGCYPDMKRFKGYKAHYKAVLAWMERNWKSELAAE